MKAGFRAALQPSLNYKGRVALQRQRRSLTWLLVAFLMVRMWKGTIMPYIGTRTHSFLWSTCVVQRARVSNIGSVHADQSSASTRFYLNSQGVVVLHLVCCPIRGEVGDFAAYTPA